MFFNMNDSTTYQKKIFMLLLIYKNGYGKRKKHLSQMRKELQAREMVESSFKLHLKWMTIFGNRYRCYYKKIFYSKLHLNFNFDGSTVRIKIKTNDFFRLHEIRQADDNRKKFITYNAVT